MMYYFNAIKLYLLQKKITLHLIMMDFHCVDKNKIILGPVDLYRVLLMGLFSLVTLCALCYIVWTLNLRRSENITMLSEGIDPPP